MSNQRPGALQFPCEFIVKVMGKNNAEFQATVLSTMRKHVSDLGEGAISFRESKERKYLAMTITFIATSQSQLDNIYTDLSASDEVLMAL